MSRALIVVSTMNNGLNAKEMTRKIGGTTKEPSRRADVFNSATGRGLALSAIRLSANAVAMANNSRQNANLPHDCMVIIVMWHFKAIAVVKGGLGLAKSSSTLDLRLN